MNSASSRASGTSTAATWRLALDAQYLGVPQAAVRLPGLREAKQFGLKTGVKDAAPPDILAVFLNLEFNY
jgi:hypothetical protein